MTDDDTGDSQALAGGDITRYRALVARISYLSQDRPDLKFASMQVCCAQWRSPRENRESDAGSAGGQSGEPGRALRR